MDLRKEVGKSGGLHRIKVSSSVVALFMLGRGEMEGVVEVGCREQVASNRDATSSMVLQLLHRIE